MTTSYRPGRSPERRRGPDPLMKSLTWLGLAGWLLMLVALVILEKARPKSQVFLTGVVEAKRQTTWDMGLAQYIFYLAIFGLSISIIGLVIILNVS